MLSKELLERFKRGEVVFHTPTQEIFDKAVEAAEGIGCNCDELYSSVFDQYGEFTGIYNENKYATTYSPISYYKENYPQLEIVNLTEVDFRNPPVPTDSPQPPQELISILRALATCVLIEKTHGVHLNLDELLDKRDELLGKWESQFEVHL